MVKTNNSQNLTFEKFYSEYYLRTYYYVQKKINNIHDAEDITCDAFLYCYHHFSDYDSTKASMSTWFYLIVNSRIKNYYRDKKESIEIEQLENVLCSEKSLLEQAVLLEEQRKVVTDAIKTLPERQQKIVIYKYFYNKTAPEIASILGISSGNVRITLLRALDKIEKFYSEYMK